MAHGRRNKFAASIFEPEVFRKQMYRVEESTCDIVVTFRRPHSDLSPGEFWLPWPSSLRPWRWQKKACLALKKAVSFELKLLKHF